MSYIRRSATALAGVVLAAACCLATGTQASARAPEDAQADVHFGVLQDVYCTATTNCWAVGFQGLTEHAQVNQVLRWNGRAWRQVPTPNPGGSAADDESALAAVRCVTARDCWAVGDTYHNDIERNQALHWNGRRWSVARTPNPGGSKPGLISELADVTCVTSANCWAVGEFTAGFNTLLNEVLHWNGRRWSQVHVVNPAGTKSGDANELYAVRCGSARNCNAAGDYGKKVAPQRNEVLHWNGARWSRVAAPNPAGTGSTDANDLRALACGAGTNCWAAGYASTDKIHNEMLHWNGRSWSTATVPNPNGNTPLVDDQLFGATCGSIRNCWAV